MTTTQLPIRADDPDGTGDGGAPRGRHRRLVGAAVLAAVLVLGAVLVWVVAFTSVLGVRSVRVGGESRLTAAQVLTAAHVVPGTPLVRLDTDAVARRIERLPEIESATVHVSLPSTVRIVVVERTAVGYVDQVDASGATTGHILVDRFGVRFATAASAPASVPRFAVATGQGAKATITAVAGVSAALPASVRDQVRSIQALDPSAITLVLPDTVVRWGTVAATAEKARILPALLRRSVTQIDVSNPQQPFTR